MKLKTFAMALVLALPLFASAAEPVPSQKEVRVSINSVYIPEGLDSRTPAYVVVSGLFQNSCYKWSRGDVFNKDEFTHQISMYATVTPGMCLMVMVPFQKDIQLGQLAIGHHNLRFDNGDGTYTERVLDILQ